MESLAHDGRGIARIEGKTIFIEGALPCERVRFRYSTHHRHFDEGRLTDVIEASSERVEPRCAHFAVCGGCSLQHLAPEAQLRAKDAMLRETLARIGHVEPREWLAPVAGPVWGYRRRARLGVKCAAGKHRVRVGFNERHTHQVADLTCCEVLHPMLGPRIAELAALLGSMDARQHLGQCEISVGEEGPALVLRTHAPLDAADRALLVDWAAREGFLIYLQRGGSNSVEALDATTPDALSYRLPADDLTLGFAPTDFVQINAVMNEVLVARAIELLSPGAAERVLDLYCGIGNFTLSLARRAAEVMGIEGEVGLVERARVNAVRNGIANVRFIAADLAAERGKSPWGDEHFAAALLDPPRSGAQALLSLLPRSGVSRIVYVSCHPATLARDAQTLVQALGYRLECAGMFDMFPHTTHMEAIALFRR